MLADHYLLKLAEGGQQRDNGLARYNSSRHQGLRAYPVSSVFAARKQAGGAEPEIDSLTFPRSG